MKLLKFLLYTILVLAALVVLLGLFGKKSYHIERSIEIDAPQPMVFEYVRYFKNFDAWSPWIALDPAQKTAVTGTDGEVGATYTSAGNNKVGEGRQIITAIEGNKIDIKTELIRPIKNTAPSTIQVEAIGKKSKVTWTTEISAPFPLNGFMMFTDVDKNIGKDYEIGLENLRRNREEVAHRKYRGYEIGVDDQFAERTYYVIRSTTDSASVEKVFQKNSAAVLAAFQKNKISATGAAAAFYYTWAKGKTDMAVGLPADKGFSITGIQSVTVGNSTAYSIKFLGGYQQISKAHQALEEYLSENDLEMNGPAIEEYITRAPAETDTTKWVTNVIYFAVPKK